MKFRDVAPFLAIASGMFCVFALLAGAGAALYFVGLPLLDRGRIDGEADWHRRAAEDIEWREGINKKISIHGLTSRYEVIPFFGNTRELLYIDQDFDTVEQRLQDQFDKRSDPYQAHLYTRYMAFLSRLNFVDDPVQLLAVLDRWVESRPESYRALAVRGAFRIRYGQYFRGNGFMNTVSRDSKRKFLEQLELAQADLDAAATMAPEDPDPILNMMQIQRARGDSRKAIDSLYAEATAAHPFDIALRISRMNAALPKWGGSWEEVDAVLAECDALRDTFPLISIVRREAEEQMRSRGPSYAARLDSDAIWQEWATPYIEQLKLHPDEPLLMTNAAYFAAKGKDFVLADPYFRALGDRYYENTNFDNLLQYNGQRATACGSMATTLPMGPERQRYFDESIQIAPYHYYANYLYATELTNQNDYYRARAYLDIAYRDKPDFAGTLYLLAVGADATGQSGDAERYAQELLLLGTYKPIESEVLAILERNR